MRVKVIHGENCGEITQNTNKWLEANEDKYVILSVSPAIPKGQSGGGYITITYTPSEKIFSQVDSPENQDPT